MAPRYSLLAAVLILLAQAALGAPPPESAEGILGFADSLRAGGESFRAATEYLRVLHHFDDQPPVRRRALEGLSETYAGAGRMNDAAETLWELYRLYPEQDLKMRLGEALYRAGRTVEASDLLLQGEPEPFARGLGTLAWLKGGQGPVPTAADSKLADEFSRLPEKSPFTAGLLSALLPGAGHLYVDRPHDALMAALLNGLFLWGTFAAADRKEWGVAGVLGAAEIFWYSGTIVGSVNGADKWNRREREGFFERNLKSLKPRWSLLSDGAGLGVAVGLVF